MWGSHNLHLLVALVFFPLPCSLPDGRFLWTVDLKESLKEISQNLTECSPLDWASSFSNARITIVDPDQI